MSKNARESRNIRRGQRFQQASGGGTGSKVLCIVLGLAAAGSAVAGWARSKGLTA